MTNYIKKFEELSKSDTGIAGGKGASLGEMTQAGISVPSGFVILSDAFETFLRETDLNVEIESILESVNHKEMRSVEHASETIQALIVAAKMPEKIESHIKDFFLKMDTLYVAVRSSATAEDSASAAWAGQLDSFLNTTEADILQNVKRCWASLFTPRAIFYRFEKGLHTTKISVAVVVQKMVESEISGIAFSVHPVTQDRNQLIIEAGFGLGEAIVSGQITPDSYVVEKEPRSILDININTQTKALYRSGAAGGNSWIDITEPKASSQVLTHEQILELSRIIIDVEEHYGFPCDIEWAFERGKFYIVQSRPITTLNSTTLVVSKKILTNIFSREKTLYYFDLWNQCDREGAEKFFGHRFEPVLFIIPPKGKKGSVWYWGKNMEIVNHTALEMLTGKGGEQLFQKMMSEIEMAWKSLEPYAKGKNIENPEELQNYQRELLRYWQTMNSALWAIIDDTRLPENIRTYFIGVRERTERYSERWSILPTEYFETHFPQYSEIVSVIMFDEMVRLIEGSVPQEELNKFRARTNGCFLLGERVHDNLDTLDNFLASQHLELERVKGDDLQEMRGTVAFPGCVQGKVKIIDGSQDIEKIAEGDILVTQMTNPKYVPAIKIAAAVVTDEGGALCHAAIVARELKKPCIIGTKIATQVLHDGDLVEVDADNGVVRIIERAEDKKRKILTEVDWELWIQRKGLSVFVTSLCYEVEGPLLKKAIGGGFDFQLSIMSGDDSKWYRSSKDFKKIRDGILEFLKSQSDEELKHFFERAGSMTEKTQAYIDKVKSYSIEDTIKYFEEIVTEFNTILLYTTSAPYFLLDTLEKIDPASLSSYELVRTESEKLRGKSLYHEIEISVLKKLEDALADHFKLKGASANSFTVSEIREALSQRLLVNSEKSVEREECVLWWDKEEGISICSVDKNSNEELINKLQRNSIDFKDVESFKGSVAFSGKVTGRVKVIHDVSGMSKMNQGDILVGHTTNPKLMSAISLCAGIITDEGGIACHAAIVARELKKPCIIGTKIATQVLHDGDLVEVDADNGVVRILEKHK